MKKVFSGIWGKEIPWIEIDNMSQNYQEFKEKVLSCSVKKGQNRLAFKKSLNDIYSVFKKIKKSNNCVVVKYERTYFAYIFPLIIENSIFGYIIVTNLRKKISENYIKIFSNYLQTLISKIQDDMELSRLYETIQPRTAALSTIHTIHRLISTSLNLKELLPRIARLSLQVMRVRQSSIYLIEKSGRYLKPVATVTEKGRIDNQCKIRMGEELVGRAAKTAVPVLTQNSLAMPLIEEDVLGVIVVSNKIDDKPFSYFDQEILTTLSEQAVIAIKSAKLHKQQEKITLGSIKSLSALSGARNAQAHIPEIKFRKLITAIAHELHLSRINIDALNYAAMLHDVGKVGIPEKILQKETTLTTQEYEMIKEHPSKSASILRHLKVLEPAIPIILYHHEKYDGSGYPEGLKGKQIPIGARILSIVDAFEAMIAKRPYRKAKSIEQATKELEKNSGTQFDPEIIKAFLKVIKRKKIINNSAKK